MSKLLEQKKLIGITVPHVSSSGGSKRFVRLADHLFRRGYNAVLYSGGDPSDGLNLSKRGIVCKPIENIFTDDIYILINHITNLNYHMRREFNNGMKRSDWSPEFLLDKTKVEHHFYMMNSKHYGGIKKAHKDCRDEPFLIHPKHSNIAIATHLKRYADHREVSCELALGGVDYNEVNPLLKTFEEREYDIGFFPTKDTGITNRIFNNYKLLGINKFSGKVLNYMYNNCKIFISVELFNDAHGWANTAAEAAACGTPVLGTSEVKALDDIVIHGVTGMRFDNEESLFNQVVFALNHPLAWAKMSENSIENMKLFNFNNFVDDVESILNKFCG